MVAHLRLGIHQAADTSDRAFRMLESGQALEVIERNRNYARVRLPDGTEGYVKVAYLVDDKTPRSRQRHSRRPAAPCASC